MIRTATLTVALAILAAPGVANAADALPPTPWRKTVLPRDPQAYLDPLGRLTLYPGERMVVSFDKDLKPHVVSIEQTPNLLSMSMTAPADMMAFSFINDPKSGRILKAENGRSTPMQYGALTGMVRRGSLYVEPTDTCTVLTGLVGIEYWEAPLTMMVLGPFETRPEGTASCEILSLDPKARPSAKQP